MGGGVGWGLCSGLSPDHLSRTSTAACSQCGQGSGQCVVIKRV